MCISVRYSACIWIFHSDERFVSANDRTLSSWIGYVCSILYIYIDNFALTRTNYNISLSTWNFLKLHRCDMCGFFFGAKGHPHVIVCFQSSIWQLFFANNGIIKMISIVCIMKNELFVWINISGCDEHLTDKRFIIIIYHQRYMKLLFITTQSDEKLLLLCKFIEPAHRIRSSSPFAGHPAMPENFIFCCYAEAYTLWYTETDSHTYIHIYIYKYTKEMWILCKCACAIYNTNSYWPTVTSKAHLLYI